MVVEMPDPRIMLPPGRSISPETMYWEFGLAVMVSEPIIMGGGEFVIRGLLFSERLNVELPTTS